MKINYIETGDPVVSRQDIRDIGLMNLGLKKLRNPSEEQLIFIAKLKEFRQLFLKSTLYLEKEVCLKGVNE